MKNQKIKYKSFKRSKGITLISLVITIAVMLIVISTTSYVSYEKFEINNLSKLEKDLVLLEDKIINYYAKYNGLPILKDGNNENIIYPYFLNFSINDEDNDNYYIIDLEAMEQIALNYGRDFEKYKLGTFEESDNDLYIINEDSKTIYYVKGITIDGETFHYLLSNIAQENTIPPTNPTIKIAEGTKKEENNTLIYIGEVLLEFIPGKDNTYGIYRTTYTITKDGAIFSEEADISHLENNMYKLTATGTYEIVLRTYNNNNISSNSSIQITVE